MLKLLLRLWWLQQRRNFRKRDAFVACYIIFLYVMVGVGFYQGYDPPWLDRPYTLAVTFCIVLLGLCLENAARNRLRRGVE